jgi:hypothetical protein
LLVAINSQIPITLAADEFLIPPTELAACGLPKSSFIKLLKLVTLHRLLVVRRIGSLPEPALGQVVVRIRQLL